MRKKKMDIKGIMAWKPGTRLIALFAFLALALVLVPLVRIAFYAVPWYDDYNWGYFPKAFYELEPTLQNLLEGVVYTVRTNWYAWTGTFSTATIMALQPMVLWGTEYYYLGALFLIALFLVSVLLYTKVLVRDVFRCDKASCGVVMAGTAIFVFLLLHRSQVAFYWYNAGVHYVGMHSFFLLLVTCFIKILQTPRTAVRVSLTIFSMFLALLIGGGNFSTALQCGEVLATIAFVGFFVYKDNRKRLLYFLPATLVFAGAFYMNLAAPGNAKRAANFEGWGYGPIESILRSFLEAGTHLWEFTGWMTLAILILLVPVIWQMVQRTDFSFRYPGLVLAWSVCVYATGFTPSLFSLGHGGLTRVLNVVRITYQLLLIFNEIYWFGWLNARLQEKDRKVPDGRVCWWFYPLVGTMMLLIFAAEPNKVVSYSTWGAFYAIRSGEAYNFYAQHQERVALLEGPDANVEFEPYRYMPFVICAGDLSADPQAEQNQAIANWYNKESVVCK